jgi:hypothetical protein
VTWSSLAFGLGIFLAFVWILGALWAGALGLVVVAVLTGASLVLPERGIQDRLAGTTMNCCLRTIFLKSSMEPQLQGNNGE